MLNMGVPKTGSTRAQIKANCGMLEAYSEIDAKEIELAKKGANGEANAANFIAQENMAMIEGFGQEISRVMFYGDSAKIAEPVGLSHYYSKCGNANTPHTNSAFNCINGGGTGSDNTSVWFVTWGPTAVHGIYPAATAAGFKEESLGYHTAQDSLGNQFRFTALTTSGMPVSASVTGAPLSVSRTSTWPTSRTRPLNTPLLTCSASSTRRTTS
jgi:hypothetical protein